MNNTQYIFDTNYYRNFVFNLTNKQVIKKINAQKKLELKKGIKIIFPNIVAIELINHLLDNNRTAKECHKALTCLVWHSGSFSKNKTSGSMTPTFHCLLTNYLFNLNSSFYNFNNGLLLSGFKIAANEYEINIKKYKNEIQNIINFKLSEQKNIISNIETYFLNSFENNLDNLWEIFQKDKSIKAEFLNDIKNKTFHNLYALALLKMSLKEIVNQKVKVNLIKFNSTFMNDFKVSIDFYIEHIILKLANVKKTEYLKNPNIDPKKRWNSFYDMQLIMATEYENSYGKKTIFVTNETKIRKHFNKFNKPKLSISVEEYNELIKN